MMQVLYTRARVLLSLARATLASLIAFVQTSKKTLLHSFLVEISEWGGIF